MFWDTVTDIAIAIAIVFAGQVVGTWLAGAVRVGLTRTGMAPEVRRLVANAVQPLVLFAAIIAALSHLGIEPTSLVAVLGAATLAIGMALRSSLSNVASGAILLTLRPYREGEFIEAGGRQGTVEALEIYATTLKTADGTLVTLANDVVLKAPIVNFTRTGARRADVEFLLAPDGKKLQPALDALAEVAAAHEKVKEDPAPAVLVLRQEKGAVAVAVRAHVDAADFGSVKAELLTQGLQALAAKKVPLASWPGA